MAHHNSNDGADANDSTTEYVDIPSEKYPSLKDYIAQRWPKAEEGKEGYIDLQVYFGQNDDSMSICWNRSNNEDTDPLDSSKPLVTPFDIDTKKGIIIADEEHGRNIN